MKIIAYDDSPVFGGHQIMACEGIEALSADPSIELLFMINPDNEKLVRRLQETGIPTRAVESGLADEFPDLLLCIQGNTSQGIRGLKAAADAGIECVSYLALPHSMKEMGARCGGLRDRLQRQAVNLPDRYITISEQMKKKLLSRGCRKPIAVVPNGINIPASPCSPRNLSSSSPCVLGLAGRIEFRQKQQDFIVSALRAHADAFKGCQLLVAGSGPDENRLRRLATGMDNISFLPWQQDMEDFYHRIDLLVISSRYEGVPLVMLEALVRGIPVVGSAVEGVRETLPGPWTFAAGNVEALIRAVDAVRATWENEIPLLQNKIKEEHSIDSFRTNFVTAVCGA